MSTIEGFEEAINALRDTYSKVYDVNEEKFEQLIENEAVADYLGENLGNQEFINELVKKQDRNVVQKIYNWVVEKLKTFKNKITGNDEALYWQKVKDNFEKAFNSEYQGKNGESVKYFIDTVAEFNEKEYNNIEGIKLPKREYAILSNIINSDSNIKPGINNIETTNAEYKVYFKEIGDFKVLDKIANETEDRNVLNGTLSGNEKSGSEQFNEQLDSKKISNQGTGTRDVEIPTVNQEGTRKRSRSNTDRQRNSGNVKYSVSESQDSYDYFIFFHFFHS